MGYTTTTGNSPKTSPNAFLNIASTTPLNTTYRTITVIFDEQIPSETIAAQVITPPTSPTNINRTVLNVTPENSPTHAYQNEILHFQEFRPNEITIPPNRYVDNPFTFTDRLIQERLAQKAQHK